MQLIQTLQAQKARIKKLKREREEVEANERHFVYMAKVRRPEIFQKIKEIAVCKFLSEHNIHEDDSISQLPPSVSNFDKTVQLKSALAKQAPSLNFDNRNQDQTNPSENASSAGIKRTRFAPDQQRSTSAVPIRQKIPGSNDLSNFTSIKNDRSVDVIRQSAAIESIEDNYSNDDFDEDQIEGSVGVSESIKKKGGKEQPLGLGKKFL